MELLTKPPEQGAVAGWGLVVQQGQRGLTAAYGKRAAADWHEDPGNATEMKRWLDQ